MFFVRDDVKEGERLDLAEEFEKGDMGLAEFLWEIMEVQALTDGYMNHKLGTRYILIPKEQELELGLFAKRLLGTQYGPSQFLTMLLKAADPNRKHRTFEVTYEHEDYGDRDPTWLLVRF